MEENATLGKTRWAFAAGFMPEDSTGHEPEFTSRDELCLLNTTSSVACAEVVVYHDDQDPVGPYMIEVPAQRVRHVRVNDLIDPQAIPLGVPYGLTISSDGPLVIQMRHIDTSQAALGVSVTSGLAGDT